MRSDRMDSSTRRQRPAPPAHTVDPEHRSENNYGWPEEAAPRNHASEELVIWDDVNGSYWWSYAQPGAWATTDGPYGTSEEAWVNGILWMCGNSTRITEGVLNRVVDNTLYETRKSETKYDTLAVELAQKKDGSWYWALTQRDGATVAFGAFSSKDRGKVLRNAVSFLRKHQLSELASETQGKE